MSKELKIRLDSRSKDLRNNITRALLAANRGHFGSSMSLVEILRVLYDDIIFFDHKNPKNEKRDRVILSKGHGCLALYSILADKNFFNVKEFDKFLTLNSFLGGHPENDKVPGVEASTGALGHGLPIAVGMAISLKLKKSNSKVFVILGDGELNEGSNWEAMMSANKHKLDNLKIIIDYNKIQSYGFVKNVLDLEPLNKKFKSFGFEVSEVNGHDIHELKRNFLKFKKQKLKKSSITICHTIKGKGFKVAENNPNWHHRNSFSEDEVKMINQSLK
ncbi:MAG: transketolase [Flavobacteriaceae bacterium TMED200]|nr:MAG: transketolase [Flavobacteriaceae bacterium TMED200]|tara:strand:+ start:5824 stop:6648 length:825 start_codon:yes stop_codon:yes gene_type:complete